MTIAGRWLSDQRRSMIGWSIGVSAAIALIVSIYPSIEGQSQFEELFESLPPAVRALAGLQEGVSIVSPDGYLQTRLFGLMLPLLLVILGIGFGTRALARSEDDGTLELLVTEPVARRSVALGRLVAAVVAVVAVAAVGTLVLLASASAVGIVGDLGVGALLTASATATGLALCHLGVAFGVGAAVGRGGVAVGVATVLAAGGYLVDALAALTDVLDPIAAVVPWGWYASHPALLEGASFTGSAAPLLLGAAVAAIGIVMFERRDLRGPA